MLKKNLECLKNWNAKKMDYSKINIFKKNWNIQKLDKNKIYMTFQNKFYIKYIYT